MMSILFAGCNKGNEVEPDRGVAQKNIGKWIVPNAIWMLPSIKQWGTMGARAGGSSTYITLRDGFRTIGGQNLKKVPYIFKKLVFLQLLAMLNPHHDFITY